MKDMKLNRIGLALLIIGCMFLVMGSTYAWFTLTLNGTKEQVITTGTLALVLDDETSTGITLDKAIPTLEEVAMKRTGYTFTLENTGDIDSKYTIYLDDLPILDSETRLEDKYVRYNIQNDQGLNKTKLLSQLRPNPNRVLDSGVIAPGQKYTYTLHVWVDYDADNNAMNKVFKGRIRVEAEQDTEYLPATLVSTTWSNDLQTTTGYFWDYKENVTKVIIQDEKKKPSVVVQEWDVSTTKDGTVMAYLTGEETTGYTLYLQANGPVKAPSNSNLLFLSFLRLENIEGLEGLDTSQVTTMDSMFKNCEQLKSLDLSSFDTSKVTNMSDMFSYCKSLTSLNVSFFDTSKVTSMWHMFSNCKSLTALDVSFFDTSKVTSMSMVFNGCINLQKLDISSFNTSQVTNMYGMFDGCASLSNLDVYHFDTTKVTDMSWMFNGCENLKSLDLSNFNTSSVTTMSLMFNSCKSLSSLDVSHFDTTNVTNMNWMFNGCENLKSLNLSSFNTTNVTIMSLMFARCKSLSLLDLSNFDTSKVTNISYMFSGCKNLVSLDLRGATFTQVTSSDDMFKAVPTNIQIIVKDSIAQTWLLEKFNTLTTTNVTVASA